MFGIRVCLISISLRGFEPTGFSFQLKGQLQFHYRVAVRVLKGFGLNFGFYFISLILMSLNLCNEGRVYFVGERVDH